MRQKPNVASVPLLVLISFVLNRVRTVVDGEKNAIIFVVQRLSLEILVFSCHARHCVDICGLRPFSPHWITGALSIVDCGGSVHQKLNLACPSGCWSLRAAGDIQHSAGCARWQSRISSSRRRHPPRRLGSSDAATSRDCDGRQHHS